MFLCFHATPFTLIRILCWTTCNVCSFLYSKLFFRLFHLLACHFCFLDLKIVFVSGVDAFFFLCLNFKTLSFSLLLLFSVMMMMSLFSKHAVPKCNKILETLDLKKKMKMWNDVFVQRIEEWRGKSAKKTAIQTPRWSHVERNKNMYWKRETKISFQESNGDWFTLCVF